MEQELVARFVALPRAGKAEVLACLANWETVRARAAYMEPDRPSDGRLLLWSKEYIHRLTGHAVAVLRVHATPADDASSIRMVAAGGQSGRTRQALHAASPGRGGACPPDGGHPPA